jgi:histidinol dehydrogenase
VNGFQRVAVHLDGVDELAARLASPPPDPEIASIVTGIIADVRARGDAALVEMTRRFDCPAFTAESLRVAPGSLAEAASAVPDALREAILVAAGQVRALAEAVRPADVHAMLEYGQSISVRSLPVRSAGIYVPGGRAAYPSTLIMAAVPAQVAGVERLAVVTPPGPDGRPSPVVLATAGLLGVDEVYAVGGPAAIAALAFGTVTIPAVSVIAGPGSAWVQEAKRQVFGAVGIDSVAGPSEVVVIAESGADARAIALDLAAQAEHGSDSPAILVSPDRDLVDEVASVLAELDVPGAITLVDCEGLDAALAFAEAFAPEHLELDIADAPRVAERVRQAGAVFVGRNGGTAFGDYVAGSNHILPTGRAARYASAVGPATFMRRMSVVDLPDVAVSALTPHLAALADAEGFVNHRRSAEARTERIAREGGSA